MTSNNSSWEADHNTPLACVFDAIPPEQRSAHFSLVAQLFGQGTQERRDLPNGYEFHFHPDVIEPLARFIANERKCCPFVDFELTAAAGSDRVTLRMTGPAGTREVLQAELLSKGE